MKRVLFVVLGLCFACYPALAFHDGGVAHCNGCHTMHNSQDGAPVDTANVDGNAYLLIRESPSDVCLSCHATSRGAVFANDVLNPAPERGAGNFIFLLEDNLNDGHGGGDDPIDGDAAGHNLNAPGYGLAPDATLGTAPGGTFNAENLGCSSCHDPHGNASFRLLHGVGSIQDDTYTFTNPAPDAEGLRLFGGGEGDSAHTAYRSGMSLWCGNCHNSFHNTSYPTVLKHPSGAALGATVASNYNSYNGTDDADGGLTATAYLNEVPFEDPGSETDMVAGPSSTSKVMCLTCHRAHASSARDAGRWDFDVTFLHEDGEESGSYQIPDPYASLNQRSLCNKCHVKDADDAPFE